MNKQDFDLVKHAARLVVDVPKVIRYRGQILISELSPAELKQFSKEELLLEEDFMNIVKQRLDEAQTTVASNIAAIQAELRAQAVGGTSGN